MFAYYETSGKKNIQIKTPDTLFQGQLLSVIINKKAIYSWNVIYPAQK